MYVVYASLIKKISKSAIWVNFFLTQANRYLVASEKRSQRKKNLNNKRTYRYLHALFPIFSITTVDWRNERTTGGLAKVAARLFVKLDKHTH